MKLQKSLTSKEWAEIVKEGPGVRMYRDKRTLFYNGEKLWEGDGFSGEPLIYDEEERDAWKAIIVLPGVENIPEWTFLQCKNLKMVIMADSVKRIEQKAFCGCKCDFLDTALIQASPFETDKRGRYKEVESNEVNKWIKQLNREEEFALHRECSAYSPPSEERLYEIIKEQGLSSLHKENQIGITALKYLQENPFFENQIEEKKLINRYVLGLMGEFQDSKEKETTNEEKVEKSCKRSLKDRVQVLCKLSIMFREQKDAIYADMKRRKLGNSV